MDNVSTDVFIPFQLSDTAIFSLADRLLFTMSISGRKQGVLLAP